jgi:hypothetical protein
MIDMHSRHLLATGILVALPLLASAQPAPSSEEQAALIAESRLRALAYTKSLPDFICTEVTRRYSAPSNRAPQPSWKRLDTLTIRLSYFGQKEDYRVIRIDDKAANKDLAKVGGWTTRGDFGSMLNGVFMPKSEASFEWQRWDTWKDRRVAVFAYRIERIHSSFNSSAHSLVKRVSANWGAKGLVQIDAETRDVLRFSIDSMDMPAQSPTSEVHLVLDYDFQRIGDREFLLPAHSLTVSTVKGGKETRKSDSEFTEYKRFSTDTKIQFGTAGEGKEPLGR